MKRIYSLITLLLALMFSGNLWAAVTATNITFDDGTTTGWTSATSGRFTPVVLEEDGNKFLSVDQDSRNNNGTTVTGTVVSGKAAAGDDFTITFDLKISNSSNQTPVSFTIKDAAGSGDFFSLTATGASVTTWKINGNDQISLPNSGAGKAIGDVTWCSYKISRSGTYTYVTVTNKETGEAIFETGAVSGSSENGGLGNMIFVTRRYNANFAIDNIVVREIETGDIPSTPPVNYTIKYVDGLGASLKDDVVSASLVGQEVTASETQLEDIYVNDKKYIYESGNNAITLDGNEANNVITLVYRVAQTWSYPLNAVYGEAVLETLATGSVFEGDSKSVTAKHSYLAEGTLVSATFTGKDYNTTVKPTEDNYTQTISYTATETTGVVFFSEAEDIATLTPVTSGYLPERFSGGKVLMLLKQIRLLQPCSQVNIN